MEKKKKIKVICNSSPIIGLAKIERLDIIEKLYQEIIVPEAVFDELITKGRDKDKTAEMNFACPLKFRKIEIPKAPDQCAMCPGSRRPLRR